MKIRNKKSGEIIEMNELLTQEFLLDLFSKDFSYFETKLNEIKNDWEVYEEKKKEYWFIGWSGAVDVETDDDFEVDNDCKEIGNYFNTREEAKKAVEKLKAWKRLNDKGFRFCGWATNEGIRGVDFEVPDSFFSENNHSCISDETRADMDLLFGGEE